MRKKFLIVCFFLIFTTSLLIGLIVNKRVRDNYVEIEIKMGLSQANLINICLSRGIETEKSLQKLVESFADETEYRISFINEKGELIADSQNRSTDLRIDEKKYDIEPKGIEAPYYKIGKSLYKDIEKLEIYTELFDVNGKKMRLVFTKELKFLKDFQKNVVITIMLGIIIAGIISLTLSLISITRITTPILKLTKLARKIALGDFRERIVIESRDEIEELGTTFNFMSEKIELLLKIVEEKARNLQNIVDNLHVAIIVLSLNGDIILSNKYAKQEFFIVEKKENIFSKKTLFEFRDIIKDKIRSKDKSENKIVVGEKIYKLKLDFIYEKELQILLVIEDITNMEKMERMRREFVSNASHELKTPVTIIGGFIETIKLGHIRDENQLIYFIEIIEKEVKRLALLTDNLLQLSKAERIMIKNNTEKKINIKELFTEIKNVFLNIAERKSIKMELEADSIEMNTKLSSEWFRTVIGNLIDNSIKYSNEESEIKISGKVLGNNLLISIEDSGIGIPKEELENIFRRFYRIDKSRNRKIEGNGLGLAIVKNMVYSANGEINIESELGKGTKIIIKLPLRDGYNKE